MKNVNELVQVEEKEVIQIESKEFNFPLYDGYNEELCDSEGNRVTRQALSFIVEDNQSGDLDRVISDMVDRYSSDSTHDIWTMMRDARDAFQDAISEGMVVVNPEDMNDTMLNAYLYLLDSELQANRSEILYNYIVYRVNKMLVDKHVTQMDIEGLEQEIENYADEAENSYSEFDYMDDEMFSQLEEFIDSYMAGLEMGQPLDNQDWENIGDVTITEGAMFIKKDEDTDNSYYVERVSGNEFESFYLDSMYIDLNDGWINWFDINEYAGISMDAEPYERISALIGYDGIENFNPTTTECEKAVDLCAALRNAGVNVVWSTEHEEIQF
ncbi:hypothetical protein [Bacillus phage Megatron]|uniref:Uncharacterized protein n=3 Tax=Wphvirus megatron TaxID=1987728 RepID=A0A024B445_9CAUD|nr:hypothetical protein FP75_gp261 [Bacillus phage Megatron]YP_009281071.1 hypothetical protein SAGEFAYGE_268 [Bacillus phage SageFayge]AHZ10843.1 hypothetical protein [Bacillus phage Megatron]AMW63188.1 hypothetical protein SAGEFAYGE_268 [Bacillus phage SageFayge]ANI24880.1 hypothetical protein SMUDGE_261 [Bacillus phage Smudge]